MFFGNITCLGKKSWPFLSSEATMSRCDLIGAVETHAGCHTRTQWAKKSRLCKWKFLDNMARNTGKGTSAAAVQSANEGGEALWAPGHRNVHRLFAKASEVTSLCADEADAFDGFMPSVVHCQGYSLVLVLF